VCISLLDPKRLASASYQAFRSNLSHGALVTASPETVDGMLESLGNLLKLLDTSDAENVLPTTYGCLRPPLGKHRLKVLDDAMLIYKLQLTIYPFLHSMIISCSVQSHLLNGWIYAFNKHI
jgi:hypothetical protein